jgi:sulfatase modifying factor 1
MAKLSNNNRIKMRFRKMLFGSYLFYILRVMPEMLSNYRVLYTTSPLLVFIISGCLSVTPNYRKDHYEKNAVPPGTVKIGENLFYDQTEISNHSYREFLFWTGKIFGTGSTRYREITPDTTVWSKTDSCLSAFDSEYLPSSSLRLFPVVGVTRSQAQKYCDWRSERVFEYMLIQAHVIPHDIQQDSITYFSIIKYQLGCYKNLQPDPRFRFYPDFQLPAFSESR